MLYGAATTFATTELAIGSTGQVLTVSGGLPSWATAAPGNLTYSNFVFNEVETVTTSPSANGNFTLSNTPHTGTVTVYNNGVKLQPTNDYTITGSTVTFVSGAWASGDVVTASYLT